MGGAMGRRIEGKCLAALNTSWQTRSREGRRYPATQRRAKTLTVVYRRRALGQALSKSLFSPGCPGSFARWRR